MDLLRMQHLRKAVEDRSSLKCLVRRAIPSALLPDS